MFSDIFHGLEINRFFKLKFKGNYYICNVRLKNIQWQILYGKPKNNSKEAFKIEGTFFDVIEDVDSFHITNEFPYQSPIRVTNEFVYLKQSRPYRYGRRTHILKFKTIEEAKKRAQEICFKQFAKKFFMKDIKITRKILTEKI